MNISCLELIIFSAFMVEIMKIQWISHGIFHTIFGIDCTKGLPLNMLYVLEDIWNAWGAMYQDHFKMCWVTVCPKTLLKIIKTNLNGNYLVY